MYQIKCFIYDKYGKSFKSSGLLLPLTFKRLSSPVIDELNKNLMKS